jgi:hypothetical protein
MSTLAIVLIVLAVILLLLFIGGFAYSRRRLQEPGFQQHVARADQMLEQARANDRGWDRDLLEAAARSALAADRANFPVDHLHLVLVDDRPGVEEDRAHMLAVGAGGEARVVLTRDPAGNWVLDRIE